jgi:3',5'-cyclic AMP phosphodiesterase CpdA
MASQSAVTLRWRTDVASDSKIEVGTSNGSYTLSATNSGVTTEHEVRISGLNSDTRYFYRFGSSSQILQGDANNFFYTAPPVTSTKRVGIAAFGDCGQANSVQTNVLNAYRSFVGSNPAQLMFLLGDNAYDDGTDAEYQTEFFDRYSSTILKNHVLFPTPGNHDYHTTSQADRTAPYFKNFTVPTAAECGGVASETKSFYSFDWGNIHFLSLDSYGEEADGSRLYDTLGPQVSWVKKDLAANTRKWTIVFWHHPPFTKGSHNSDAEGELIHIRENFIQILERYGVDLILCGHSHVYERSYLLRGYYETEAEFDLNTDAVSSSSGKYNGSSNSCPYLTSSSHVNHGTVYVVSGSASRSGAGVESTFPHDALPFATTDGGMFYLEIEDNRLNGKMIDANGSVFDQFTILKDVNKRTTTNTVSGQQQQLTASWIGSYKWSTGETTRTITVAPQTTTTYTVTDNNNCLKDVFEVNMAITSAKTSKERNTNAANSVSNVLIASNLVTRGEKLTVYAPVDNNSIGTLYNYQGQLIRTIKILGTTTIETGFLPAGVYVLAIKNKNGWYKQKFVIRD